MEGVTDLSGGVATPQTPPPPPTLDPVLDEKEGALTKLRLLNKDILLKPT